MKEFSGRKKAIDPELYKYLLKPRFSVKDLKDISSRMINYWHNKGFLFINDRDKNNREWRKFSFIDYIWLRMLKEMSELGLSVNEVAPRIMSFLALNHPRLEENVELEARGNLPLYMGEIVQKEQFAETFGLILTDMISFKNPLVIIIPTIDFPFLKWGNPDYLGIKIDWPDEKNEVETLEFDSYISLSVSKHVLDFLDQADMDNISDLNILSKPELEVLQHMRNKELKQITIRFEKGKPVMLELTDTVNKTDVAKRLSEYLIKPYQNITFKTFDGKTTTFERTIMEKIIE